MTTSDQPTGLERCGSDKLIIQWSSSGRREYMVRELRDACPCATCREKRMEEPQAPNPLQILTPGEARPLSLSGMKPVGQYAYNIEFSDGHDTGIYPFDLLRRLGREI